MVLVEQNGQTFRASGVCTVCTVIFTVESSGLLRFAATPCSETDRLGLGGKFLMYTRYF